MNIQEGIDVKLKDSLKSKNEEILSTLRTLKSVLKNKEIDKKDTLSEEEVIGVLHSEVKKRKESADLYKKANRQDLSDKEEKEVSIISEFLPKQMDDDELLKIVVSAIAETKATSRADMGKVMAIVMSKVNGRASGSDVSRKVAEELNK